VALVLCGGAFFVGRGRAVQEPQEGHAFRSLGEVGNASTRGIAIVTVNTAEDASYPMPGAPGKLYINFGVNFTWAGWDGRAKRYADELREYFKHDIHQVVIVADGGDVLFGGCSDLELLSYYHAVVKASNGSKVVFGAQIREYPKIKAPFNHYNDSTLRRRALAVQREFGLDDKPYIRFINKAACNDSFNPYSVHNDRLNAGFVIGPAGLIADMYDGLLALPDEEAMSRPNYWNDQMAAANYMFHNADLVTLDYSTAITVQLGGARDVQDMLEIRDGKLHNTVTGKVQCFVNGNGDGFDAWLKLAQGFRSIQG